MPLRISVSPAAWRGLDYTQRAIAVMDHANGQRVPYKPEYGRLAGTVSLLLRFPPMLWPYIETPLGANYPDIAMQPVGNDALDPPSDHGQWSVTVWLRHDLLLVIPPEEEEKCGESDAESVPSACDEAYSVVAVGRKCGCEWLPTAVAMAPMVGASINIPTSE